MDGQPAILSRVEESLTSIFSLSSSGWTRRSERQAPLLISAHYDTVMASPGADDNASALAVLLEVADQLKHGRHASRVACRFLSRGTGVAG